MSKKIKFLIIEGIFFDKCRVSKSIRDNFNTNISIKIYQSLGKSTKKTKIIKRYFKYMLIPLLFFHINIILYT